MQKRRKEKERKENLLLFWQVQEQVQNFFENKGIYATETITAYVTICVAVQAINHKWKQVYDWKIAEALAQLYRHEPIERPRMQGKSAILRFLATWDAWTLEKHPTVHFSTLERTDGSLLAEEFLIPTDEPAPESEPTEKIKAEIEQFFGGIWAYAEAALEENLRRNQRKKERERLKQQQLFAISSEPKPREKKRKKHPRRRRRPFRPGPGPAAPA